MSFQDIDEVLDRALEGEHNDQVPHTNQTEEEPDQQIQPSFNQSAVDPLNDSLPIITQTAQRSLMRKSFTHQQGVFQYLIENESRLFEFFQYFNHKLFALHILQQRVDNEKTFTLSNYQNLQVVRRKLFYLKDVYAKTFQALKNSIKNYKEKLLMTDGIQSDDPYETLTQPELELRRGLHLFFNSLEEGDLMTMQSRALSTSQHLTAKTPNILEVFDLQQLISGNQEYIAQFLASCNTEVEDFVIDAQEILNDKITMDFLTVIQKLLQIWSYSFDKYRDMDQQQKFEGLSSLIIAASTLAEAPLDIYAKLFKNTNKSLQTTYATRLASTDNVLLLLRSFDELFHLTQKEEGIDQATKMAENFSFSDQASQQVIEEEITPTPFMKMSDKSKTKAIPTFDMKINYHKLNEIKPLKHQQYIYQSAKQWRRVCPVQINRVGYRVGTPIEEKFVDFTVGDYFQDNDVAALYQFKAGTTNIYFWTINKEKVNQESVVKHTLEFKDDFGPYLQHTVARNGDVYIGTPFSSSWDKSFYKLSKKEFLVQQLANHPEGKRKYGFAILGSYLYVLGGQTRTSEAVTTCERFSLKKNEWHSIQPMSQDIQSPNIVIYQDRYIIRFGGFNRFGYQDKTVEIYDTKRHKWSMVRVESEQSNLQFNTNSVSIQVSAQMILIVGGQNQDGYSENGAYILELSEMNNQKNQEITGKFYQLDQQNVTLLSYIGQLDSQAYMQDGTVWMLRRQYSIQNEIKN